MENKAVIFGVGDFAQVADVYLSNDSPYEVVAFTVHEQYITGRELRGRRIVAFEELEQTHPPDRFSLFVAVGYRQVNKARANVYQDAKQRGYRLISYVNSKTTQWGEVEIGDNVFIFENNVIQPFARIGNDVILWGGGFVGHHSTIEDHCFVACGAAISGRVVVGPYSFVGTNATIRDNVTVARECVIGAGALILEDTQPQGVYPGSPARALGIRSSALWRL
ncbi:MAG: acetyltransferase [Capsulimonadaceae bacterium]